MCGHRPGSRLGEVGLSRLGPPKSSQIGFICHRHRFPQAQSVLSQVDSSQNTETYAGRNFLREFWIWLRRILLPDEHTSLSKLTCHKGPGSIFTIIIDYRILSKAALICRRGRSMRTAFNNWKKRKYSVIKTRIHRFGVDDWF